LAASLHANPHSTTQKKTLARKDQAWSGQLKETVLSLGILDEPINKSLWCETGQGSHGLTKFDIEMYMMPDSTHRDLAAGSLLLQLDQRGTYWKLSKGKIK